MFFSVLPQHDSKEQRDAERKEDHDGNRQHGHSVVCGVKALEAVVGRHVVGAAPSIEGLRAAGLLDKLAVEEIKSVAADRGVSEEDQQTRVAEPVADAGVPCGCRSVAAASLPSIVAPVAEPRQGN